MVPWPIALLSLFYGVIATLSASSVWRILMGVSDRWLGWSLAWLMLSGGAMCGLALLHPWGRRLAIGTSVCLLVVTLALAGLFVRAGQPLVGLLIAFMASVHVLIIRYLQRPRIKRYFGFRNVDFELDHSH